MVAGADFGDVGRAGEPVGEEELLKLLKAAEERVSVAPGDVEALISVGQLSKRLGDLAARAQSFDEAIDAYAQSVASYDEALRHAPREVGALVGKGDACLASAVAQTSRTLHFVFARSSDQKRKLEAGSRATDLEQDNRQLESDLHTAEQEAQETYRAAAAAYEGALALEPGNVGVLLRRATALSRGPGLSREGIAVAISEHREAVAACDQAIRLEPQNIEARVRKRGVLLGIVALQMRALPLETSGELIEACEEVLRQDPTHAGALTEKHGALASLAELQADSGSYDEAFESYAQALDVLEQARELAPENSYVPLVEGGTLAALGELQAKLLCLDEALESYQKAIAAYDQALALSDFATSIKAEKLQELGALQLRLLRHEEAAATFERAVQTYDKAIEQDPNSAVRYGKGKALLQLGELQLALARPEQGLKALQAARTELSHWSIELSPEGKTARELLRAHVSKAIEKNAGGLGA